MFELMFWTDKGTSIDFYTQDGNRKCQDYFSSEDEALDYVGTIIKQVYNEHNNLADITVQNVVTGEIFVWDYIPSKTL